MIPVRNQALFKLALTALACAIPLTSMAAHWDGPYVGVDSKNQLHAMWVEAQGERLRVRQETVAVGSDVVIPAVGVRPAFKVKLRDAPAPAAHTVALPKSSSLFVVADTHGEFEIATELLLRHRIIDDQLRWAFGKGHLVFLGDVFDRGPNQTELLWLMYKLEGEAQQAGGGVHLVLGNHESMVLLGDERYLHRKYVETQRVFHAPSYAALWGTNSVLGKWLRTKAAVMKVGDNLCVHGGVSAEVVARNLTLDSLNATVRDALMSRHELPSAQNADLSFVLGPKGPLWHRGYFGDSRDRAIEGDDTDADVARVLEHFKARRVLVGHTRVPTVTPLYGGKVVAVQVYPHRDEQSGAPIMEALLIEGGKLQRARVDGTLEALEARQ